MAVRPPSSTVPIRCIEKHPTRQSVWFAGQPINLQAIADSYAPPLNHSYLSLIFSGQRTPSLGMTKQLARALGMELGAFVAALDKERG